jgi:hypothetical protein
LEIHYNKREKYFYLIKKWEFFFDGHGLIINIYKTVILMQTSESHPKTWETEYGKFDVDTLDEDERNLFFGQRIKVNRSDKYSSGEITEEEFLKNKSKEFFTTQKERRRHQAQFHKTGKFLSSNFIRKKKSWLNNLVISPRNKTRNLWDFLMLVMLCYSCISTGY